MRQGHPATGFYFILSGAGIAIFQGVWIHFQGEKLCCIRICFPSQEGSTLKEKNKLLLEYFFPLRLHPSLIGLCQLGKLTGSQKSYSPSKMADKHGGAPIHLVTF